MDGAHDMGGVAWSGPVEPEPNEPVFHAPWERRAFALTMAMGMPVIMLDAGAGPAGSRLRRAMLAAERADWPFRHWCLRNVLPEGLGTALAALPFAPPPIGDTLGKRETHNASRLFVSPENRRRFGACATLAEAFSPK